MTTLSFNDSKGNISMSSTVSHSPAQETPGAEDEKVHEIGSLRTTLGMTRSASKWYKYSLNLASPTEEALRQKSTLMSLMRLCNDVKELNKHIEENGSQHSALQKTFMLASQRCEMSRFVDVWEIRIITGAAPLSMDQTRSNDTPRDQLQAFQSLFLTWGTPLAEK
eukprot:gb/GEZJ01003303.1/.p3 GENE.gb/GEZJ01003303.1/~~gb/GEZJ01003303.1/.p3  ORF type:complete len:166 (-),score=14.92 gb/GEZJ01003303.1/:3293-3790(-)